MPPRLLGLFAGGLDGLLAIAWLLRRGFEVTALHFDTGFVKPSRHRVVEAARRGQGPAGRARVETIDVRRAYLDEVVRRPRFGYGAGMNACLDCRIFMLRRAAEVARARGADLLFTGEVVGQRAMDQSRAALDRAEREAGIRGGVLRPLSAGLLPQVLPGCELRLHGRARRDQLALARELGIADAPTPSGGCCLLADRGFAGRLRDLLSHREGAPAHAELEQLRYGRHFRLAWNARLIVGRNETESTWLRQNTGSCWAGQLAARRGAVALYDGPIDGPAALEAAALVARYGPTLAGEEVEVTFERAGVRRTLRARPAPKDRVAAARI